MLVLVIGYTPKNKREGVCLYAGHDHATARALQSNPPAGYARMDVIVNPTLSSSKRYEVPEGVVPAPVAGSSDTSILEACFEECKEELDRQLAERVDVELELGCANARIAELELLLEASKQPVEEVKEESNEEEPLSLSSEVAAGDGKPSKKSK